ncbi:Uncharacterized protein HZ326_27801 [Fusarium oxysporum f. sp. albedinis]|nr:Uncharacterized protein HZ326_27801 [Fusarium oxysporum f. sp. albedinis]
MAFPSNTACCRIMLRSENHKRPPSGNVLHYVWPSNLQHFMLILSQSGHGRWCVQTFTYPRTAWIIRSSGESAFRSLSRGWSRDLSDFIGSLSRTLMMSTRSPLPPRPNNRRGFEIAIICALPLEADAIEALFDHYWDGDGLLVRKAAGDHNAYSTGVIGCHNVVLVRMPGMGKVHAAAAASNCRASFPNIKIALLVGLCGVAPFKRNGEEVVLGDVVISEGIVQYDFGRRLPGRFVPKDGPLDTLGRPNQEIRGILAQAKGTRGRQRLTSEMARYLEILRHDPELRAEYPDPAYDRLFEASYRHSEDQKSCEQVGCDGKLVPRRRLQATGHSPAPAVHFGLMASGDSVMKSGEDRDRNAEAGDMVAFEMEGAGVWDILPCVVVKGACDYADSHKSKVWQRYAAATAAACAKAFLDFWVSSLDQGTSHHTSGDGN